LNPPSGERAVKRPPLVALTAGEPAGIGPDLAVQVAARARGARVVIIGDRDVLAARARAHRIAWQPAAFDATDPATHTRLSVLHVPAAHRVLAGRLDPANSPHVIAMLETAADGCLAGHFDAMVTAPVHKGVINDAGIAFTGHTEFLAARAHAPHVVMLLAGRGLRVALATTHLALQDVPAAITRASLTATLEVLAHDLRTRFGFRRPRILVAGLNPHAGEGGHFGREEIDVIAPVIAALRKRGIAVEGPLPADTLFNRDKLARADCVLAMYHDQGLPVLKYATFGAGVNVTLGLPFVRTSVDHGTALDLAAAGGRGADAGSLRTALALAVTLAARRRPARAARA
jgi:4-hydroxythreonine-4-phosphate dehydrogenase